MTRPIDEIAREMREAAEKATPGGWQVARATFTYNVGKRQTAEQLSIHTSWFHPQLKAPSPVVTHCSRATDDEWAKRGVHIGEDDARHIVAANPANILALLDDRDAKAREIEELRQYLKISDDAILEESGLADQRRDTLRSAHAEITALTARLSQAERERDEAKAAPLTGTTAGIDDDVTHPETWQERAENTRRVLIMAKRRAERAESSRDALAALLRKAAEGLKRSEKAIGPFAGSVYNDNGDLTVTNAPGAGYEFCCDAYFVRRQIREVLAEIEAATKA